MADEDWDNRSEVSYESEISGITKSTLTTEDASEVSLNCYLKIVFHFYE